MTTLKLKPNSRKKSPLVINTPPTTKSNDWEITSQGIMTHNSGFKIQFFNQDECEILNIPEQMPLSSLRELSNEAMKINNARS